MTPYEITLAYEGFMELEGRRNNEAWERTRQQCYMIYCSIPEGKKKKKSIDVFWPKKKNIPTKEERAKIYAKSSWHKK